MNRYLSLCLTAGACALLSLTPACAAEHDEDPTETTAASVTTLSPAELAATKTALRALCYPNISRTDNLASVRSQVDPLVAKLARHFGSRSAQTKLPMIEGAWRQIWSDFPYPMAPFIKMDLAQVYQVVSADGYYWNLGDSKVVGLFGITGVLRGRAIPNGTKLDVMFTNSGFRLGRLGKNVDLVDYASELESGERGYLGLPGGGPVGISGTLETLYVDDDLRIERGTQDVVLDDEGNVSRPPIDDKLFILDRVTKPTK